MLCCVVIDVCKALKKMKLLWRCFCSLLLGTLLSAPYCRSPGDACVWRVSWSAGDWKSSSFWFGLNTASLLLLFKLDVILRPKTQTAISLMKMICLLFSPFSPPDYSQTFWIPSFLVIPAAQTVILMIYIFFVLWFIITILYIIYVGVRYSVARKCVMQMPCRRSGLWSGTDRVNFHSLRSSSCLCPYIYTNGF